MLLFVLSLTLGAITLASGLRSVKDPPYWYTAHINGDENTYLLPYTQKDVSSYYNYLSGIESDSSLPGQIFDDMTEALLYTTEHPYGTSGQHTESCKWKKCGPDYACVAPTGIPRCLPLDCLDDPLHGNHTFKGSPGKKLPSSQTLQPLEWQFTPEETKKIVKDSTKRRSGKAGKAGGVTAPPEATRTTASAVSSTPKVTTAKKAPVVKGRRKLPDTTGWRRRGNNWRKFRNGFESFTSGVPTPP